MSTIRFPLHGRAVKVSLRGTAPCAYTGVSSVSRDVEGPRSFVVELLQDGRLPCGDGGKEFRRVAHLVEGVVAVFEEGMELGEAGGSWPGGHDAHGGMDEWTSAKRILW